MQDIRKKTWREGEWVMGRLGDEWDVAIWRGGDLVRRRLGEEAMGQSGELKGPDI
jgi:hypothetical protein